MPNGGNSYIMRKCIRCGGEPFPAGRSAGTAGQRQGAPAAAGPQTTLSIRPDGRPPGQERRGYQDDRSQKPREAVRQQARCGRHQLHHQQGGDPGLFGAQRCRQIHHHEHDYRLPLLHLGDRPHRRPRHPGGAAGGEEAHRLSARAAAALPGHDGEGVPGLCLRAEKVHPAPGAAPGGDLPHGEDRARLRAADQKPLQGLQTARGGGRRPGGRPRRADFGRAHRGP